MRLITFSRRCAKEILRDPINLIFSLGFPLVLLLLLSAIQANIPAPLFQIEKLTPGVTVFGLSFLTLFSATLIARDRESALLQRLYTTPLRPADYILGYMLPLLPFALLQSTACYLVAALLGLPLSAHTLLALLLLVPIAIFFIALGLLCGSVLTVKQAGGVCGALLTNLSAWLSGIWFDLQLVGGTFEKIAHLFPFVYAVEMESAAIADSYARAFAYLPPVLLYAAAVTMLAVFFFLRQMKRQ